MIITRRQCWDYTLSGSHIYLEIVYYQNIHKVGYITLVEITLLHLRSPANQVHVCRAPFCNNNSGKLLLNQDRFCLMMNDFVSKYIIWSRCCNMVWLYIYRSYIDKANSFVYFFVLGYPIYFVDFLLHHIDTSWQLINVLLIIPNHTPWIYQKLFCFF